MSSGQDLARISQGAHAGQEGDRHEREADPDNIGAGERIMIENGSDGDSPGEGEYSGDMQSADNVGEDGEEERGEQREEIDEGQDRDKVEQRDKEEVEEEGSRELEDCGEERKASSLVVVVPSQMEITGITIDEETWRTFDAKPIGEKLAILVNLAFAVTICVLTFGYVLWAMSHANIVVVVE